MVKTAGLGCITYAAIAVFGFGSLFQPIGLATLWSDRLGAPYWPWIVVACFAVGATSFLLPSRFSLLRAPLFIAVGLVASLLCVGSYVDHLRSMKINAFGADRLMEHTFLESVRHAPNEFQLFLHAAALKDCIPYSWSYRTMDFYRLPPDVAVNVLPRAWLVECSIHSSNAISDTW